METLAASRDLDDPKVKTEVAAQVLPLIEDVPSPIERDTYRQRLARLLRVDESALTGEARARPARGRRGARKATPAPAGLKVASPAETCYALEAHALGVLLRRPDLLYQVDRALQESGLTRLTPADFQHAGHQSVLRLLQESVDQDLAEPLNFVLDSLSLPMMELADGMLERTRNLNPSEDRVLGDLLRALLDLRCRNLHQSIEYIRFLMEDAQDQGDLRATQYQQTMVQHTLLRGRLDRALGQYTSRAQISR
jgi:DNA primase